MNDNTTRSRAPNFDREEQLLLFSILKPYKSIIESKNSVKQIDKQRAWSRVTAKYNANTKGVKRTTNNLISCYRNTKNKLKKQQFDEPLLKDLSKKEALLNAFEEHGKDMAAISSSVNIPADICQSTFLELHNIAKKEDTSRNNPVLGTDPVLPIHADESQSQAGSYADDSHGFTSKNTCPCKKKKSVIKSFYALSREKMDVVKLQRTMLEMEMNHKYQLYTLELEDKLAENKFKAELRQKELHLIQLKINKETQ